ncbi:MAG TPA: bifunctional 4-hydroxy-2-oxoglutarate aldolase/2-dehydro-3-deoxy-phosphogluconate aldolase [Chryseosolibacter sp.]
MAFSKQEIFDEIKRTRVVPLFTHDDPVLAVEVLRAAYDGGVRVFEFTNRRKNSFDVFGALVKHRSHYPDLMLGIGTIMDPDTTSRFIDAGADFIISPIMKPSMAEICHHHKKHWMPGCATLTEIVTAKEFGAEIIKIFPGAVLGPGFVSAIMPVVPDLNLMITGGVEPTEQNLSSWFKAGAMAVGMGSQLFTKEILENRDWTQLKNKVSQALAIAAKQR